MLNFELLRAFVAVADCGGFHRAAERLNLTQSTVSQQIKRLELETKRPLFRRTTLSVALTDDSEMLLGDARRLLQFEEAATRVATLGLQQVAAGLDDRLGMLTCGRRTALPRHRTPRAKLDWSYELLPEPERLVMRRLAVFAGDFTAEAARLVVADGEITPAEAVCSLANLI